MLQRRPFWCGQLLVGYIQFFEKIESLYICKLLITNMDSFTIQYHVPYPGDKNELEVDQKLLEYFDMPSIMKYMTADCLNNSQIFVYHKFENSAIMICKVFESVYVKAMTIELCDAILGTHQEVVNIHGIEFAFVHDGAIYIEK